MIECARYEMTTLYQQLGDADSAVVLTDTDGAIVHMVSSPEFAAEAAPLGLREGSLRTAPRRRIVGRHRHPRRRTWPHLRVAAAAIAGRTG